MIKKNRNTSSNFNLSFLNSLNSKNDFDIPSDREVPDLDFFGEYDNLTIEKLLKDNFDVKEIIKILSWKDLIIVSFNSTSNSNVCLISQDYKILKNYSKWTFNNVEVDIPLNFQFEINISGNLNFLSWDEPNKQVFYYKTNNIFSYTEISDLYLISSISIFKNLVGRDKPHSGNILFDINAENIISIFLDIDRIDSDNSLGQNYFIIVDTNNSELKLIQRWSDKNNRLGIKVVGYSFNYYPENQNQQFICRFSFYKSDSRELKISEFYEDENNNTILPYRIIKTIRAENPLQDNGSFYFLSSNYYLAPLNFPLIYIQKTDKNFAVISNVKGSLFVYEVPDQNNDFLSLSEIHFSEINKKFFLLISYGFVNRLTLKGEAWIEVLNLVSPFSQPENPLIFYNFRKSIKLGIGDINTELAFKSNLVVVSENNYNKIFIDFNKKENNIETYRTQIFTNSYNNNLFFDDLPYFFNPKYGKYDFFNQRVKVYDAQNKLIGDLDIIANLFSKNTLSYLIKIDQYSLNDSKNRKWFLITDNNNLMFDFNFTIDKTRFENKNINFNLTYKNIDNTNNNNEFLPQISSDTIFGFTPNSNTQSKNIIAINYMKIFFDDLTFKIFDFKDKKIGIIENEKFFINKTFINKSSKKIISFSFHNKNSNDEINNIFFNYKIDVEPNKVLTLSISGELKEEI